MLEVGPPREIRATAAGDGIMIFTDACYEKLAPVWRSGIGGIQHKTLGGIFLWSFLTKFWSNLVRV